VPRLETGQLARRAAGGAAVLLVRQGVVYGSSIAAGIILARLFTPAEFGFYGVVLFCVTFLNIFGGTGFAANLIRTEEHPTLEDFRAVFTGQQVLVGFVFLCLWGAAPWLASYYHMQQHGSWFFRLIALSLVFTSLMVVSQVLMERELAFGKIAVVEVTQGLIFNVAAVVLAWRGMGVMSLAIALALRSACGALLSNLIEPWAMGWLWNSTVLKRHLRFGVALQASQFIALAKDSITPLFVGIYLGAAKMGYVTWANTLATYPTMILIPLQRVYLPFFARLQSDRERLSHYAAHALWMTNAIAAPLVVITTALAYPITILIFGSKWLVALPLFYCLAVTGVIAAGSIPLLGLINAIGKSHITLTLAILWTGTTWACGVPLMMKFGLIGFGITMILVHIVSLGLFWVAWREISLSVFPAYWPSWPIAIAIGCLLFFAQRLAPIRGISSLLAAGFAGFLVYGATLWFGSPKQTRIVAGLLRANGQ
jgi:teichuronic acid exporter